MIGDNLKLYRYQCNLKYTSNSLFIWSIYQFYLMKNSLFLLSLFFALLTTVSKYKWLFNSYMVFSYLYDNKNQVRKSLYQKNILKSDPWKTFRGPTKYNSFLLNYPLLLKRFYELWCWLQWKIGLYLIYKYAKLCIYIYWVSISFSFYSITLNHKVNIRLLIFKLFHFLI